LRGEDEVEEIRYTGGLSLPGGIVLQGCNITTRGLALAGNFPDVEAEGLPLQTRSMIRISV